MDDMDVTDEGNRPTMKTNRRDKIRKQRNAFGESSANNDRSSLKCHRTDFAESSSYEALFEPRLRRHCSEKGKPSSRPSSSSSRQRPSRQRDAAAAAAAADTAAEDDVDAGGGGRCNRSLSCRSRAPLRPTELNFLGAEPRRRTYSMPSKNKRAFIDSAQRQAHQRSSSSSSTPEDFYRVRTFSTSSKGILNKGDSFKRKRRAAAAAAEAEKKGQTTAAVVVVEATGKAAKAKKPVPATSAAAAASSSASVGRSLLQTVSAERSRVLVMGGPGVGKRSIMQQFLTSEYMGTADSTHEDSGSMTVSVVLDEVEASLDLVHHPSGLASLPQNDRADAYCIVYSVSDRDSFLYARELLSEIRKKSLQREAAQILVANKADLVRQRQVAEDEGKLMAARYRGKFVEVSTVLNHKIDDLLVGIVRQIQLKRSGGDGKKTVDDGGCYPQARELVDLILGKQRRVFNSCDNLLVL